VVVVVRAMGAVRDQSSALAWVALVDGLYAADLTFGGTGCDVGELFDPSSRHGGYRKRHGRCESRLGAMLGEASSR
jgi:cell division protein ZapE